MSIGLGVGAAAQIGISTMNQIKVDTAELKKSADRIEKHLQSFVTELNALYNDDIYQIADGWKSKDSYEWINKFVDYISDLKEIGNSIEGYIAFLRMAADEYEDALTASIAKAETANIHKLGG